MDPDEFHTRLTNAWTEENGEPSWVERLLIERYAERMEAADNALLGDLDGWHPTGFLAGSVSPIAAITKTVCTVPPPALRTATSPWGASSSVPPNWTGAEEERIARELVPLVRAAAAEEQVEILRGEASIAACLAPEPTPRLHSRTFPCWCGGFASAFGDVHLDERVQHGTPGYMFNPDDFEGWFRP